MNLPILCLYRPQEGKLLSGMIRGELNTGHMSKKSCPFREKKTPWTILGVKQVQSIFIKQLAI